MAIFLEREKGGKMKKVYGFLLAVVAFFAVMVQPVAAVEPWNDGEIRDFVQKTSAWSPAAVAPLSGTTMFVVDVSKSGMVFVPTNQATGGCSIYFTGQSAVPTKTTLYWAGAANFRVTPAEATGYSPVSYFQTGATAGSWPFTGNTSANRIYRIDVYSGIGGVVSGRSGTTVYIDVSSGVTTY